MNRILAVLSVLLALALVAAPSIADMTVKLKDGRVFTLPVNPEDVDSMSFGPAGPGGSVAPPLMTTPPAAAPTPFATTTTTKSGGVPPIPGISAPAMTTAVTPPSSALIAPPSSMPAPQASKGSGRVLHVGQGKDYKTPSAAFAAAKNGDTIEIDTGNYIGDTAIIKGDNLTIRGVGGGRAHVDADGESANGKAIWVTTGNNTRIENIEFSGAKVGDGNGAGIRAEGVNLTLFNCFFHDNQEGILAGDNPESDIIIDSSAFVHNGTQSGQVHGIYINHIRTLVVRGSVFQLNTIGHHIKSRADTTYVLYNRIADFADGTASYDVDLSNGGRAYIIGNMIEKGPKADNFNFIAMAMEGPTNSLQELYVINNTMVLDRSSGVFVHSRSPGTTVIANNIMSGPGDLLQGTGKLINNIIASPSGGAPSYLNENGGGGNKVVRDAAFVDPSKFDYHLKPGSPAIGAGTDMGAASGYKLAPDFQNLYPLGVEARPPSTPIDAGAYRFANASR